MSPAVIPFATSNSQPFLRIAMPWLVVLLVACDGNAETSSPLDAESVLRGNDEAFCEALAVCPEQLHAIYPSDVGLALGGGCAEAGLGGHALEVLVERGNVTVDSRQAARCLEATAVCKPWGCAHALLGTLEGGAPCVDDMECRSGECRDSIDGCGICGAAEAPAKLGAACRLDADCDPAEATDVRCLRATPDADRTCIALRSVARGQACTAPEAVCEGETYCHTDGTCHAPRATGQDCAAGERCERGTMCASNGAGRNCIPVVVRAEGESCTLDFEVSSEGNFEVCDRTRDLRCSDDTRTCAVVMRVGEGQDCGSDTRCEAGLFCDDALRCAAPRPNGEPCSATFQCQSWTCEADVCVAPPVCR